MLGPALWPAILGCFSAAAGTALAVACAAAAAALKAAAAAVTEAVTTEVVVMVVMVGNARSVRARSQGWMAAEWGIARLGMRYWTGPGLPGLAQKV